jgi:hypothetical protein
MSSPPTPYYLLRSSVAYVPTVRVDKNKYRSDAIAARYRQAPAALATAYLSRQKPSRFVARMSHPYIRSVRTGRWFP